MQVGSSVIHLGDHNVPNALLFVDKYCQVGVKAHPKAQAVDMQMHACSAVPHALLFVDKYCQVGVSDHVRA